MNNNEKYIDNSVTNIIEEKFQLSVHHAVTTRSQQLSIVIPIKLKQLKNSQKALTKLLSNPVKM